MTLQDMTDLVTAYDGTVELEKGIGILIGKKEGYLYDEGAIGKLSRITKIIARNSPLHEPDAEDFCSTDFCKILENTDLSPEERAKRLLGESL